MDAIYDRAVALWLAKDTALNPDKISNIEFGMDGGYAYSEYTQADDHAVIHYIYETVEGRKNPRTKKTQMYHSISYESVGNFVAEVSEIIQELRKN